MMTRRTRLHLRNRLIAVLGLPVLAALALIAAAVEVVKPLSKRR